MSEYYGNSMSCLCGLGSESPRTHLSPCVLLHYNTRLYIVVHGDSEPIPFMFIRAVLVKGLELDIYHKQ